MLLTNVVNESMLGWGWGGVGGVTKEREGERDPKLNGSQVKPLSSTPT